MFFENFNYQNTGDSTENKYGRVILQGNECLTTIPAKAFEKDGGVTLLTENGRFVINADDLSTGTMVIGATGCGKTTFFKKMLDSLLAGISPKDIFIIFDSKGDYKKRYYDPNNPNHIIISVSDKDKAVARSWNIFGELLDGNNMFGTNTEIIAGEIAKAMFKGIESDSQPFFHLAAEDIFAKLLTSFVLDAYRTKDYSALNNEQLYNAMANASNQLEMIEKICKYDNYKYISTYVGNGTSNQALGVFAYLSSMLSQNFISTFRHKQPAGDFSMRRLVREKGGKVVFLEYDINYSEALSSVYSLFYDLAIKEALSGAEDGSNTYFICDELNLIPYVSRLEQLLNFGRSKGCKTMVGLQSVSQLKKNYEDDEADSILAGFLTAICFRSVDTATRKYIKERFGETFESYHYAGSNISREGYTVTDSEIINLQIGEIFVDMKNTPPFKTRLVDGG